MEAETTYTDNHMKVCKDCKFYDKFWLDTTLSKCKNPKASGYYISPVNSKIEYAFCRVERQNYLPNSNCGPEARYFESKKSIWQRFLDWRDGYGY